MSGTLANPFRLEVGPYWLLLPGHAKVSAKVTGPTPGAYQTALTHWFVTLGRFQLIIHLESINDLTSLKSFILSTTKIYVETPSITINGVNGVTHGDYGPPQTWIDWYFKKGDIMICICLQAVSFTPTQPTAAELAEHRAIIGSLKYSLDFPSEDPPLPDR